MSTKHVRLRKRRMPPNYGGFEWPSSLPFVVNPRAVLVHRVRSVHTHESGHQSAEFWCGNVCCGSPLQLTDEPPKSRLLCNRCEIAAVAAGEQPASKICGRHVHIGRMVPKRICCQNDGN